jgi:hypothetical protein
VDIAAGTHQRAAHINARALDRHQNVGISRRLNGEVLVLPTSDFDLCRSEYGFNRRQSARTRGERYEASAGKDAELTP